MKNPLINNGKGSRPRPVKGDIYRERFEQIFGKKEEKKTVEISNEKTLCPHCATVNLVQESVWLSRCRKCGYEKL
jgi:ribosomal protein L37AE/L43A